MSTQSPPERNGPILCPVADMGFIELAGADVEAFLNAQLSVNVESGKPPRTPLSAWLNSRGRVLALFRTLRSGERWLLLAKGAEADTLIRRLRMFVLRADVQVRNVSSQWRAGAVLDGIDPWLAARSITLGVKPGDTADVNGAVAIRVGPQLTYLVADGKSLEDLDSDCQIGHGEAGAAEEIRLGLVDMVPELVGRYTAHMLNLDLLGAVAFDKGCYPGQEVIARTQNLGQVKRRVFRFSGALRQVPALGAALVDSSGNAVGEVVRAACTGETSVELLAVVRVDAVSSALTCAAESNVPLTREALPQETPPAQPISLD